MNSPFSIFTKKFVVYPVSLKEGEFVACLCPKCKDPYIVGSFYLYDESEEESEEDGIYISGETATCINCGQGDLPRPLLFLTSQEAVQYVLVHDTSTFFKVSDTLCEMCLMDARIYMNSQRNHVLQ